MGQTMGRGVDEGLVALKDHVIVCGLNPLLGHTVCQTLVSEGKPFVVVEPDLAWVARGRRKGWLVVAGDPTDEDIWDVLRLDRAHSVISTMEEESTNLKIILLVREQRPDCPIVACCSTRASGDRLRRVGANQVISPLQIGGAQMANIALRPTAIQFFDMVFKRDSVEVETDEVMIPHRSPLAGVPLSHLYAMPELGGVIVVGYVPSGGEIQFNPDKTTVLHGGDLLICLSHVDDLERLRAAVG